MKATGVFIEMAGEEDWIKQNEEEMCYAVRIKSICYKSLWLNETIQEEKCNVIKGDV